jgi:hypothetical protein
MGLRCGRHRLKEKAMPNWCENQVEVSHPRTKKMRRLIGYIKADKLLYSFAPYPNGKWNYDWCVENWDTKWDIGDADIFDRDTNFIEFSFSSAWSPPINIFFKMKEQGYYVKARYAEPGMDYAGIWQDGDNIDWKCHNVPMCEHELQAMIGSSEWQEENNEYR